MREPWLDDGDVRVWLGDAREALRNLPDESVQCIVTSPPFWGLRDYATGKWEGGDGACDHLKKSGGTGRSTLGVASGGNAMSAEAQVRATTRSFVPYAQECGKCGARRVDDQIGNEETPEGWIANLVLVFRECRRVLRRDGVCWIEVGDTYMGGGGHAPDAPSARQRNEDGFGQRGPFNYTSDPAKRGVTGGATKPKAAQGYKPKDLVGAPWMLAFALRADGWWLRAENIWYKRNPMPESVTDRTTRAHSQVFLLSKAATYFYDADAIAEEGQDWSVGGPGEGILTTEHYGAENGGNDGLAKLAARYKAGEGPTKRNARSVWEMATANTKVSHFAVMPDELAEKCIKAGTSEHGCCGECGAPWRRVVEKGEPELRAWSAAGAAAYDDAEGRMVPRGLETGSTLKHGVPRETVGWVPTCSCRMGGDGDCPPDPVPCTVLDPFMGSGTTAFVARKLSRRSVGVELSAEYLALMKERLKQPNLLTWRADADDRERAVEAE